MNDLSIQNIHSLRISKTILPIFIKNFGDIFKFYAKFAYISQSSAIIFLISYIKEIFKNKVSLFFCACSIISYLYYPYSVRSYITFLLFFIFYKKIKNNIDDYRNFYLIFIVILSVFIFFGIFNNSFYSTYYYGKKYRFLYNDANNFGPYVCAYLAIMVYYFNKKRGFLKLICFFISLALFYCIYLTYGRMYTVFGFFILLLGIIKSKKKIFLILLFFLFFVLYKFSFLCEHFFIFRRFSPSDGSVIISLSGRDVLWNIFYIHLHNLSWLECFFPNLETYLKLSASLLRKGGHSIVENSYYVTFLTSGFLGLGIILSLQFTLIRLLLFKKAYKSLIITALYFSIVFFDDSFIFPISVIHQLIVIHVFSLIDKNNKKIKHYETLHRNQYPSPIPCTHL